MSKTIRAEIKSAGSTDAYVATPMSRKGFYKLETANYTAIFSRNTETVNWGANAEHFCRNSPEDVLEALRAQI